MMAYTTESFLHSKNYFFYSSSMNDGEFINYRDIVLHVSMTA